MERTGGTRKLLKFSLVGAFVILTNSLFAVPKHPPFDPGSVSVIAFSKDNCKHFDETGVGCTEAILSFSRFDVKKTELPEVETVLFVDPRTGVWQMTLRYYPRKCSLLPAREGDFTQRFLCKEVSWRTAR